MDRLSLVGLAYQNLRRKPYRAVFIGLCVALATGSLFAMTLILQSVQTSLEIGQARLGADVVVVPAGYEVSAQEAFITGQPSTFYMRRDVEARIALVPGVQKTSTQVYVQTLSNAACCIGEFFLVGFDPQTDFTISPWLATYLAGRSLGPQEAIVGDRILLREGDGATVYGMAFTVAGVLEKTGMGIDRTIYIPLPGIHTMILNSATQAEKVLTISPEEISAVMVQTEPGAKAADVAEAIEARVDGVQAFTASQLNQAVNRQLNGILGIILSVTAALWAMSLVTIGLVFSVVVNERQRELGLLRAMGARRRFVFRLVICEAGMLTGLSGMVGILIALAMLLSFSRLLQQALHIPYLMPTAVEIAGVVLVLLGMAFLIGALASLLPAFRSSRMVVYEAIRQGE
jgi:putative ABC transport system permease protein